LIKAYLDTVGLNDEMVNSLVCGTQSHDIKELWEEIKGLKETGDHSELKHKLDKLGNGISELESRFNFKFGEIAKSIENSPSRAPQEDNNGQQ